MFESTLWLLVSLLPGSGSDNDTMRTVQQGVLNDLARVPTYTCTETIDRMQRTFPEQQFRPVDRVRVEIAIVNGYEMFGWPGEDRIAQRDLTRMVAGFIGSGDLTMHVREVFSRPPEDIVRSGFEDRQGHAAIRYNFRVTADDSGWRVRANTDEVLPVGYHGSFWIGRDSLDLLEVDFEADDVPRVLGFADFSKVIRYSRVRIGDANFMLPQLVRTSAADLNGEDRLNEARFEQCHQYSVESVIRYDAPEDSIDKRANVNPPPVASLPDTFEISALLENGIDSDGAAIGDPVRARTQQSIRVNGTTVVPKNATLVSRIVRINVVQGHRYLDFVPTHFLANGQRIDLHKRRNELRIEQRRAPHNQVGFTPQYETIPMPIRADGQRLRLPAGTKFVLVSRREHL